MTRAMAAAPVAQAVLARVSGLGHWLGPQRRQVVAHQQKGNTESDGYDRYYNHFLCVFMIFFTLWANDILLPMDVFFIFLHGVFTQFQTGYFVHKILVSTSGLLLTWAIKHSPVDTCQHP